MPIGRIVKEGGVSRAVWDLYPELVLEDRERNSYDDSDFYGVVWDEYSNKPMNVEYGSTRYHSQIRSCRVDATPDVRRMYELWRADQHRIRVRDTVKTGRLVQFTRGRHEGRLGTVKWSGYRAPKWAPWKAPELLFLVALTDVNAWAKPGDCRTAWWREDDYRTVDWLSWPDLPVPETL